MSFRRPAPGWCGGAGRPPPRSDPPLDPPFPAAGEPALASKGPGGPPSRLSAQQLRELEQLLGPGPAAAGFTEDARWTLARVAQPIATRFRIRYSLEGVPPVLRRLGWTPQMPIHRAVERDEEQITRWPCGQWPAVRGRAHAGRVDLPRRRGRTHAEASQGSNLGPARTNTGRQGDR